MKKTYAFHPELMSKYYLVHAYMNEYVWFETYDDAHDFLFSKWVDNRFAKEVIVPAL
jgi:hypothetical protein